MALGHSVSLSGKRDTRGNRRTETERKGAPGRGARERESERERERERRREGARETDTRTEAERERETERDREDGYVVPDDAGAGGGSHHSRLRVCVLPPYPGPH